MANECIYCGPSIVDSIHKPFEEDDEMDGFDIKRSSRKSYKF